MITFGTILSSEPRLRTTRNGFSAFTVNNSRQLIAAAEYGINPEILLYKYASVKDKKEPLRIKGMTYASCHSGRKNPNHRNGLLS